MREMFRFYANPERPQEMHEDDITKMMAFALKVENDIDRFPIHLAAHTLTLSSQ